MAPWDLIFQLLAKAQPALYIGNDLDEAQTQIDLRYRHAPLGFPLELIAKAINRHVEDFKGFPLETYLARGRREMPQSEQYSWMNHGAINYACHALPIIV